MRRMLWRRLGSLERGFLNLSTQLAVRCSDVTVTVEGRRAATQFEIAKFIKERVEAPPGFEPGVEVLQTSALPLGDGAP